MTAERETELRMALRHVRTGRGCISRQGHVVATLRDKGLPADQAEAVLHWLEETQREFENRYRKVLSAAIDLANDTPAAPPAASDTRGGGYPGDPSDRADKREVR